MLDKIKSLAETAKGVLMYILAPILIVGGYIFYLCSKIGNLKEELSQTKAQKELGETLAKKSEAENEANQDESDYLAKRDAYIKQLHSDVPGKDSQL